MLELNYRDARPIYEQIKDGLRRLILSDVIRQNERLPSVRDLAIRIRSKRRTGSWNRKAMFIRYPAEEALRRL